MKRTISYQFMKTMQKDNRLFDIIKSGSAKCKNGGIFVLLACILSVILLIGLHYIDKQPAYAQARMLITGLLIVLWLVSVLFFAVILRNAGMSKQVIAQEEYFNAILNNIIDPLIVTDSTGLIEIVNDTVVSVFNYSSREITGKSINSLFQEELFLKNGTISEQVVNMYDRLRQIIQKDLIGIKHNGNTFNVRITISEKVFNKKKMYIFAMHDITKDKESEKTLQHRQSDIEKSNRELEKARKAALSIMQDANIQKKRAQEMLTELEHSTGEIRKLSQAIEQSHASVLITDKLGTIEYANQSYWDITGFTKDEVLRGTPGIPHSGLQEDTFYTGLWDTINSGNVWSGEMASKKKNGEILWESATISPVKNDDNIITHFIAVKEDITRRKQMEEELRIAKENAIAATKAKSDFLANMSHEIRTPMNAIIGMNYLLQKTKLTGIQADYVQKIQQSSQNLLGIINDILDFSKIEAGKLDIESIDFNLNEVITNFSNAVSFKAQEKGLEFIINISREVPTNLIGDPLRLGQVLLNLANNAIKFTAKGEVVLSIEVVSINGNKGLLNFSVRDTGIGLTNDERLKLFRVFSQADSSTTRKFGGTGLGLSICKRLTEMMGGEIGVESAKGKGSTFVFTSLFTISDKIGKQHYELPVDMEKLCVMVVDDNRTARDVLREYLEDFNVEVVIAASGQEAIEMIENRLAEGERKIDIILMDWQMPGLDGIETSELILANQKLSPKPKIIMVTGYGREEIVKQANGLGLDAFLLKPVTKSLLFDSFMTVLGKRAVIQEQKLRRNIIPVELNEVRGAHILLVEDNDINQEVAQELLESEGFSVEIAENGAVALDKINNQENNFDLVLMDIQMPVMDGYETTKKIRQTIDSKTLPILAMTADAMSGVREIVLQCGMNDFITKPINTQELFSALARWIKPGNYTIRENASINRDPETIYLPRLNGIDSGQGLYRVAGNEKLYIKLLRQFHSNNQNITAKIQEHIDRNEFREAELAAHTLKGVAGNLGADKLSHAAAVVTHALKKENLDGIDNQLQLLHTELQTVLTAIDLLPEDIDTEYNIDISRNVDESSVKKVLVKLNNLLDSDIAEGIAVTENLKELLDGSRYFKHYNEISGHINNFDIDQTRVAVMRFADKMHISLEE